MLTILFYFIFGHGSASEMIKFGNPYKYSNMKNFFFKWFWIPLIVDLLIINHLFF